MAHRLDTVEVIRQYDTPVPVPQGVNRFITIVGKLPNVPIAGERTSVETYTCLVGPVLREDEFLGANCHSSIANLDPSTMEAAECTIDSSAADRDTDSGRTELCIQLTSAGGAARATILFSVTILSSV